MCLCVPPVLLPSRFSVFSDFPSKNISLFFSAFDVRCPSNDYDFPVSSFKVSEFPITDIQFSPNDWLKFACGDGAGVVRLDTSSPLVSSVDERLSHSFRV